MELNKNPVQVTLRWVKIGQAVIDWTCDHILPNPDGYHSDHFTKDKVAFQDNDPTLFDYYEGDISFLDAQCDYLERDR